MGFYPAGQNQTTLFFESGTWGNTSGAAMWPGQVQSADVVSNINLHKGRYTGRNSRNVGEMIPLAKSFAVTKECYPQDFRMLGMAMGSIYTHNTGSPTPPVTHQISEAGITELNAFTSGVHTPFMSFTMDTLEQFNPTGLNINKRSTGIIIDSYELSSSEGAFITEMVNGQAKNSVFTSGTGCAITEITSPRPYMWRDASWYVPSGTNNKINGIKSWRFKLNNTATVKNYAGGGQTPDAIPVLERNYEVELVMDKMSQHYKTFNDAYVSGTKLNMFLGIVQNAGSNYGNIWMSGCVLDDLKEPLPMEGLNEVTATITPTSCNAFVGDSVDLYTPW